MDSRSSVKQRGAGGETADRTYECNKHDNLVNRAVSTAAARNVPFSSGPDDQYPPRLAFKTTDHVANTKPRAVLSAKRADGEAAVDPQTTDDEYVPSAEAATGRHRC
jgi:hypothetical protein